MANKSTVNNNNNNSNWQPATKVIHGGCGHDDPHGSLAPPLYQTSTFKFANSAQGSARFAGEEDGYIYSRLGNPTTVELETRVAELEGYEAAAATATGMGAIAATTMAFVKAGDHIIVSDAIYGCSFALFSELFERFGITADFIDLNDLELLKATIKENTQLVFLETPANPHLKLVDIKAVSDVLAGSEIRLIVDNTFMTPLLQQPKQLGADLVVHSATKFLNGHGDVVAGLVCGSHQDIMQIKGTTLKDMGATISPHDAWLILRGLKTLDVRMQRHCENAERVAQFLDQHDGVRKVYYPGLKEHPGHELIGRQMQHAGAVIAMELEGDEAQARYFLDQLKMIPLAVSLGDAETLIQHPASMTHSPYTAEARQRAGISDTLVRIAVGLEAVEDIIADLQQALEASRQRWQKTA
ncbi:methionine gamma-lyase [Idiomarina seosinensis]|uniref:L-methionine gamma-lyase n=1 Tax=Idiomarina seosinensis TaxID=281739 RepID=A0A432ZHG7_9GAMM|nr:methionine gamma-lyase [Idiomarina seosinensis]RUO77408.1 methionine gamma-lyase [Idiomarina seosinensis]